MPDFARAATISLPASAGAPALANCGSQKYQLPGPQVEPGASHWLHCFDLRMIAESDLLAAIPNPDPYPTDRRILEGELQELIEMARLRDEPGMIGHAPCHPEVEEAQRERMPLSLFLDLRPQPFGAVINSARGPDAPVLASGRELARYFEGETPGLSFQLALNFILSQTPGFSPPRQAAIWAGLHVTIASALAAAWFYKWRGGPKVQYRPRPWECYKQLDVLFDRVTNSTNSDDGARRGFPFSVRPQMPHPGELERPERRVRDVRLIHPGTSLSWTGFPTPGTPRHPAYPSGHSTYSAAAAHYLSRFFPSWRIELTRMADNIGMARLWAGVHWRTDHTFGRRVGTTVADLVIKQMTDSKIFQLSNNADPMSDIAPPETPTTDPAVVPDPCEGPDPARECDPTKKAIRRRS